MKEELIKDNFDIEKTVPTEEAFQIMTEAYKDFKLNGDRCSYAHKPQMLCRVCEDAYEVAALLVVAVIMK